MSNLTKKKLIGQILKDEAITNNAKLKKFVNLFYSQLQIKDLSEYEKEDLVKHAVNSFDFISSRKGNDSKIIIRNFKSEKKAKNNEFSVINILNDDKPFLVDSIVLHIDSMNIAIKNIIHPIVKVKRNSKGQLENIVSNDQITPTTKDLSEYQNESIIQIHLNSTYKKEVLDELKEKLLKILQTVSLVVDDWHDMLQMAETARQSLYNVEDYVDFDRQEVNDFVRWVIDKHFIFLAAIEFDIVKDSNNQSQYKAKKDSRLKLSEKLVWYLVKSNKQPERWILKTKFYIGFIFCFLEW